MWCPSIRTARLIYFVMSFQLPSLKFGVPLLICVSDYDFYDAFLLCFPFSVSQAVFCHIFLQFSQVFHIFGEVLITKGD